MTINNLQTMKKKPRAVKETVKKKTTWEAIGHIAVDAGMLWISDPCRVFWPYTIW
jgi:hypothetical protein